MSPGTSLPRSSPGPGRSPWKQPTRPGAPFCLLRVLTPQGAGAGAWEGAGFTTAGTAAGPAARAERAERTEEHSPSSGCPTGSGTQGARSHPGAAATQAQV